MNPTPQLCDLKCAPCRGGIPPLTREEIAPLLAQVPEWNLSGDARSISRAWAFKNFSEAEALALSFGPKVGALAEEEGHHPDVAYGWGYYRITLMTHAINGLHQNDFILAAKIDRLA